MAQFLALMHGDTDMSSDVSKADACSQQNTDTWKSTDGSVVMVSSSWRDVWLCVGLGDSGYRFGMNTGHGHSGELFYHYRYLVASSFLASYSHLV